MSKITSKRKNLFSRFTNKQYRDAYVESQINNGLSFQIRAMRKNKEWSQEYLAGQLETKQTAISRLENPNYGKFSIEMLKKLASLFDVALMVRFVPFSELANRTINLSDSDISVPSYQNDDGLQEYSAFDNDSNVSKSFFNAIDFDSYNKKDENANVIVDTKTRASS